jgi:hypothetical protein
VCPICSVTTPPTAWPVALAASSALTVARLDLPATADQQPAMAEATRRMAAILRTDGTTSVILIGYGDTERVDSACGPQRRHWLPCPYPSRTRCGSTAAATTA